MHPALIAVIAAGGYALGATGVAGGTLSLQVENDRIARTDRHYTAGERLFYVSDENDIPAWVRRLGRQVPFLADADGTRVGFTLGQSIFTPEDTDARKLVRDDRPYAGWLYGGVALLWEDRGANGRLSTLDTVELDVGVVGPAALGREIQNGYHDLIGVPRSLGWRHQLDNEQGVLLSYERKWRTWPKTSALGLEFDATPHAGGSVGNVMTHVAGGLSLRFGERLADDYGPPRIRPSLPGSVFFATTPDFDRHVFADAELRYVARDVFLDGNSFTDSHGVERKPVVGDVQLGVTVIYRTVRLSYTHVFRSDEFEGQRGANRFGSVSLSVNF